MAHEFDALAGPADEPVLAPGAVIDRRYRVVRLLGRGGMGAVYEAEHVLVRRRVALKLLHPAVSRDREMARRFHREALASSAIGHPNIVEVQDMGRLEDGAMYMVLELLRGRDWGEDIEATGPQPLGRVARVMTQLCAALGAAHDVGIVHRDLKPENVYLCPRTNDPFFVKVLDFGISKFREAIDGAESGLTSTGVALGTPFFMPPEQLEGKRHVDHRADVYALGVAAYHALAGEYPFHAHTLPALLLKVCTQPPDPITAYRRDLPPDLVDGLVRMIDKDPDERPQRCDEVAGLFAAYLELPPGELPPTPPVTSAPPPRSESHAELALDATRPSERPGGGAPDAAGPASDALTRARETAVGRRAAGARPLLAAGGGAAAGAPPATADPRRASATSTGDGPAPGGTSGLPGAHRRTSRIWAFGVAALVVVATATAAVLVRGATAPAPPALSGSATPGDAPRTTEPTDAPRPSTRDEALPVGADMPADEAALKPEPAATGTRDPSHRRRRSGRRATPGPGVPRPSPSGTTPGSGGPTRADG